MMDLSENVGSAENISTDNDVPNDNGDRDVVNVDPYAVNGESYASRAARTAGLGAVPLNLGTVPVENLIQQLHQTENRMPQRPKTAFFTPHQQTSARSVFDAFVVSGVDPTEISCLQRKMNGEVVVTFKTMEAKDRFLGLNSLLIDSQHYAVQDIDRPLTYLTIYDAPFELSDLAIIKRLSPFCEVIHYRRGKHNYAPNVYNGLRHYRVRIIKPIPSFLRFGRMQIYLKHNGQHPTCRRCNSPGHYSNACTNKICFNCEKTGHEAGQCPHPLFCCICKETGHLGANCHYSWVFPTVQGVHTDEDETVNVEDDQPASPNDQQHSPSAAHTDDDPFDENLPLSTFLPPPTQFTESVDLPDVSEPSQPEVSEPSQPDVSEPSQPDPQQSSDPATKELAEQPPDPAQSSQSSSAQSPFITSQGLIASLKCAITSSSRRTPAKLSTDSSLACLRKPTQPTPVSGKSKSSIPVPTAPTTPSSAAPSTPVTTDEIDMETSHDLKRKSSDLSPSRKAEKKKGRNRNSKKSK